MHKAVLATETSYCLRLMQESMNNLQNWKEKRVFQNSTEVKSVDLWSGLQAANRVQKLFQSVCISVQDRTKNFHPPHMQDNSSVQRLTLIRESILNILERDHLLQVCKIDEALVSLNCYKKDLLADLDEWFRKEGARPSIDPRHLERVRRDIINQADPYLRIGFQESTFQLMPPLANYLPRLTYLNLALGRPLDVSPLQEMSQLKSLDIYFKEVSGMSEKPLAVIFPKMLVNVRLFGKSVTILIFPKA